MVFDVESVGLHGEGFTVNKVDFYEADSEEQALEIAQRFNDLWKKGVYQKPSVLAKDSLLNA
jgi:hypothetical protein